MNIYAGQQIIWSNPVIRFITTPGMALQNLTTNEPDEKILEVSIAAFNAMYELENTTTI